MCVPLSSYLFYLKESFTGCDWINSEPWRKRKNKLGNGFSTPTFFVIFFWDFLAGCHFESVECSLDKSIKKALIFG